MLLRVPVFLSCILVASLCVPGARADAGADLSKYSVFQGVDPASLSGGKVITARGPALNFPRDLSIQALYLIHAPVARTMELHRAWDPGRHSELKVYAHHDFSTHPSLADFSQPLPGNSAFRKLADATSKLPDMGELQMSKAEADDFKKSGGNMQAFWSQLLLHRATAFLSGGLSALPPYDSADGTVRVSAEVSRLLGEQPRVRAAFAPIISHSPLGGGGGQVLPYWELFDVEGQGAFSLGATSSVQSGDSAQMVDLQYYASGGYYVFVTLYDFIPVTVDGKPATLVWRVDTISSLSLSDLSPFERMGSGAAMMKDIQRIINFFEKDSGR
jgi:hypothetical protein